MTSEVLWNTKRISIIKTSTKINSFKKTISSTIKWKLTLINKGRAWTSNKILLTTLLKWEMIPCLKTRTKPLDSYLKKKMNQMRRLNNSISQTKQILLILKKNSKFWVLIAMTRIISMRSSLISPTTEQRITRTQTRTTFKKYNPQLSQVMMEKVIWRIKTPSLFKTTKKSSSKTPITRKMHLYQFRTILI